MTARLGRETMSDDSQKQPPPIAGPPPEAAAQYSQQDLPATAVFAGAESSGLSPASAAGDDEPPLPAGSFLKHFRIARLIGRGGMGDVYEAHDESLERTVAIKVIRSGRNIAPQDHAHLVHEARA